MKKHPTKNSIIGLLIFCIIIGVILQLCNPNDATEISEAELQSKMQTIEERSFTEEDTETYTVISTLRKVSGINEFKAVFVLRPRGDVIISVFTEKEYPINSKVKLAWIHHRSTYYNNYTIFPIVIMRCE